MTNIKAAPAVVLAQRAIVVVLDPTAPAEVLNEFDRLAQHHPLVDPRPSGWVSPKVHGAAPAYLVVLKGGATLDQLVQGGTTLARYLAPACLDCGGGRERAGTTAWVCSGCGSSVLM